MATDSKRRLVQALKAPRGGAKQTEAVELQLQPKCAQDRLKAIAPAHICPSARWTH
jgi:hypothetical protein